MLFCIKRCKVARGCSVSDLAAQRGRRLPLAVSPGRRPSEKAQGRSKTHASQKGTAGFSEQPRRASEKSWPNVLSNENRSTTKKKKKKKKTDKEHSLEGPSVNDNMLLRVIYLSRIWEHFQKLYITNNRDVICVCGLEDDLVKT